MTHKRLFTLLFLFLLAALLFGCQRQGAAQKQERTPWYCNRLSADTPPFSLPDGAQERRDGEYGGISRAAYDAFVSNLKTDGFSYAKQKYSAFLFRDDCMAFLRYSEAGDALSLSWYQKSPFAPENGISSEEAAALLTRNGGDSLSKIALHPIDVTPEGFYERTGGQMFAVPYYSYDSFRAGGIDDLMFEDNEWYGCTVYYVNGDTVLQTTMQRVAVCDLDGDGSEEVLLLSYGPTRGVCTFDVMVVTKNGMFDTIFNTEHGTVRFSAQDGRIVVTRTDNDSTDHVYDIALEEQHGETIVMLYAQGEPLTVWGAPNTRNHTILPEAAE